MSERVWVSDDAELHYCIASDIPVGAKCLCASGISYICKSTEARTSANLDHRAPVISLLP